MFEARFDFIIGGLIIRKGIIHDALAGMFSKEDIVVSDETNAFHHSCPLFDLHNDFLMYRYYTGYNLSRRHHSARWYNPLLKQTDIPRLKAGGVTAIGMGLVSVSPFRRKSHQLIKHTLSLLACRDRMLERFADDFSLALHANDITNIKNAGKIALITELEGPHLIGEDCSKLEELYSRGVRLITMAHFRPNVFASSSYLEKKETGAQKGSDQLTAKGHELVDKIQQLGIILDLAHTPRETFLAAAEHTTKPFVVSHTGISGVHELWRNIDDDCIHATAEHDGVIGIILAPQFLTPHFSAPFNAYIDHLEYIIDLVGARYAGIGSDLDGWIPTVNGFRDAADFPKITQLLFDRGHSKQTIRNILGENAIRVFNRVCR